MEKEFCDDPDRPNPTAGRREKDSGGLRPATGESAHPRRVRRGCCPAGESFLAANREGEEFDVAARLAVQVDATTFGPNPFRDEPTAVREQAMRLDRNWYDEFDCTEEGLSRECIDAIHSVRDAYLALTDPTPLSVEVLVRMGFTVTNGPSRATKGNLSCDLGCTDWVIRSPVSYRCSDVYPLPRTAGELRQLLLRLESPHAAR